MNNILQLKGTFQQRSNDNKPGPRSIPNNSSPITTKKLKSLLGDLQSLTSYWQSQKIIEGCLIDVHYIDVIAKSNRIKGFFYSGKESVNNSVVGARFAKEEKRKHIITHYVSARLLESTVTTLQNSILLLDEVFKGSITSESIKQLQDKVIDYDKYNITKTTFRNILVDTHYIDHFSIPDNSVNARSQSIITIYKTDTELVALMKQIGVVVQPDKIISETTLFLYPNEIALLSQKAPYLIAMATEDLSKLSFEDIVGDKKNDTSFTINEPNGEPIIGVIDTLFDKNVYFSEWVDYRKIISDEIPTSPDDFIHGTSVTSLIVDGPAINPDLDDGCGRFRVRHFGVAAQGRYSAFSIVKAIKEIVASNPDIKVWNLSLGSEREINPNFISPEAAILDQIQFEHDVIFVVAGTNKLNNTIVDMSIGSPADSINAIVVNSVNRAGNPASYSRKGLVLSFFNKPDVSSFGGDKKEYIWVYTPKGLRPSVGGTSFAAPWVTRKIAFLIEILGFSREVAKALIVDAAAGWNGIGNDVKLAPLVGHGIVPKRIEDIDETPTT